MGSAGRGVFPSEQWVFSFSTYRIDFICLDVREEVRFLNPPEVIHPQIWPLGLFFVLVLLLVIFMLVASHILGQRRQRRDTGEPYECGIVSTGSARVRFGVKFYLVAMFFVIFDLEAVFVFAWAVAVRDLGWIGFSEIVVFIVVLVAGLFYLWRVGALDWGTLRHQKMQTKP